FYFRRLLDSGAVDVLQADITRCGGVTGWLQIAALCQAHNLPISAHTAPALPTHVACAVAGLMNLDYFYDHVRIEQMFFDGLPELENGELRPDLSRPGMNSSSSVETLGNLPPEEEKESPCPPAESRS